MRGLWIWLLAIASFAQAAATPPAGVCGQVVTLATHGGSTTRYALAAAPEGTVRGKRIGLVLLVGGGGYLDLDEQGCPRALTGNSLVRMLAYFHEAGFVTALVDAPSDHPGDDGLAGFRSAPQHADDIGKVIADLRARTHAQVWLAGTSRGTISAANAAARLRLSGPSAPDGLVLTSALMSGQSGGYRPWVAQTVFDFPLETLRMPLLIVGHADDKCIRSPPDLMGRLAARTRGVVRQQLVTVSGGPGYFGPAGVEACAGNAPHGYVEQEAEVAAGIARFIHGKNY
ncbi:MAG: alpha/beta hydrolase [Betaproteobacteria bacterium]|nr:alpha/beta hydrolase [Betaproteobacteria bacterium]